MTSDSSSAAAGRNVGEAYAFFRCDAETESVAFTLDSILRLETDGKRVYPVGLTLELYKEDSAKDFFHGLDTSNDPELREYVRMAGEAELNYAVRATLPKVPEHRGVSANRGAADELGNVLNQTYNSPLFNEGEPFRGEIIYKHGGRYVRKRQ